MNTLQISFPRRLTDLAGERDEFTCKRSSEGVRSSVHTCNDEWFVYDISVFWQSIHPGHQESVTKKRPSLSKLQSNLSPEIPVAGYLIIVHTQADTITCMHVQNSVQDAKSKVTVDVIDKGIKGCHQKLMSE